MTYDNPLRHCQTEDTVEIIDLLLGDLLLKFIGKNDMAVVSGLMSSAAIMIIAHCERTGQDLDELATLCRTHFDLAIEVGRRRAADGQAESSEYDNR